MRMGGASDRVGRAGRETRKHGRRRPRVERVGLGYHYQVALDEAEGMLGELGEEVPEIE